MPVTTELDALMLLVLSTFPDAPKARLVGKILVTEKLAACVTLVPKAESFFVWEGKMQAASEVLVLFKTSAAVYAALEARLNELHPYDVPEIVAVPVECGLPAYLAWVTETCATRGVGSRSDEDVAPLK
jgi:periplasmic divalent cation tolerance protein